MKIQNIELLEDSRAIFPLMHELREHLTEASFLELLSSAKQDGHYKLLGAQEGPKWVALMGYRIIVDFVHGRHLYIDDLVVSKACRSQGIGKLLLNHAKELALASGCSYLRLCTGIENHRGKKFYEDNKWDQRAVVYKLKV